MVFAVHSDADSLSEPSVSYMAVAVYDIQASNG